jgi:hypothetical protein
VRQGPIVRLPRVHIIATANVSFALRQEISFYSDCVRDILLLSGAVDVNFLSTSPILGPRQRPGAALLDAMQ